MPVGPGPKKRETNKLSQRRVANSHRAPSAIGTPKASKSRVCARLSAQGSSQARRSTLLAKMTRRTNDRAMLPSTMAMPPMPSAALVMLNRLCVRSPAVRATLSRPKRISRTSTRSGTKAKRSSSTLSAKPGK
jgi:hypothetical protein